MSKLLTLGVVQQGSLLNQEPDVDWDYEGVMTVGEFDASGFGGNMLYGYANLPGFGLAVGTLNPSNEDIDSFFYLDTAIPALGIMNNNTLVLGVLNEETESDKVEIDGVIYELEYDEVINGYLLSGIENPFPGTGENSDTKIEFV